MNSFRALLLIPYLVLQISGLFTISSWVPRQLAYLTGMVRLELRDDSLAKTGGTTKSLPIESKCENSPICHKEAPLTYIAQPQALPKDRCIIQAKRAIKDQPNKNKTLRWHLHFDGTGNAELF